MFGSYPVWVNNYYKVRLTVEAANLEILSQVDKVTFYELLLLYKLPTQATVLLFIFFQMGLFIFIAIINLLNFFQDVRENLPVLELYDQHPEQESSKKIEDLLQRSQEGLLEG